MAKFCTKCGRKLEEGEVCSCSKAAMKVAAPQDTSPAGEIANKVLDIIKGIFVKPITTMKKYIGDKNNGLGWVLIAIAILAMGLLTAVFADKMTEELDALSFGFYSLMNDVDSFEVFLYGALGALLVFVLMATGVYLLTAKAFGKNVSFGKVISMIGLVGIITAGFNLVTTLALLLNGTLAMVVFLIGGLYASVNLYHGIKLVSDLEDDRLAWTYVGTNAFVYLVLFVLLKLLG